MTLFKDLCRCNKGLWDHLSLDFGLDLGPKPQRQTYLEEKGRGDTHTHRWQAMWRRRQGLELLYHKPKNTHQRHGRILPGAFRGIAALKIPSLCTSASRTIKEGVFVVLSPTASLWGPVTASQESNTLLRGRPSFLFLWDFYAVTLTGIWTPPVIISTVISEVLQTPEAVRAVSEGETGSVEPLFQ